MSEEPILREVPLVVGGRAVVLLVDDAHLQAHLDHFFLPFEGVLALVAEALGEAGEGLVHRVIECQTPTGRTGCVAVGPKDGAFWGYRRGRRVPSHLVLGEKQPTREFCVWGEWLAPDRFRLFTVYPGGAAPREIHDPDLPLAGIDASIAFWTGHALVVSEDDFTRTPG